MSWERFLSRRATRPTLLCLGWQHLLFITSGMATVLLVFVLVSPHEWADLYANEVGIKRFETSFGFRWGTVTIEAPRCPTTTWCVMSVVPGGAFSRLGLRAGDVPFWHTHGGAWGMYEALSASSRGRTGSFDVINIHGGGISLREINVPPLRGTLEASPSPADVSQTPSQNISSCWSDPRIPTILALGKDHAPDARAKLKAIAGEAQRTEGREMAKVMLRHWDAKDGSYHSTRPWPVIPTRFSPSPDDITRLAPTGATAGNVYTIKATLDASGCVSDGSILKPGPAPALTDLALKKLLAAKFLPARPERDYLPVEITITNLIDYW